MPNRADDVAFRPRDASQKPRYASCIACGNSRIFSFSPAKVSIFSGHVDRHTPLSLSLSGAFGLAFVYLSFIAGFLRNSLNTTNTFFVVQEHRYRRWRATPPFLFFSLPSCATPSQNSIVLFETDPSQLFRAGTKKEEKEKTKKNCEEKRRMEEESTASPVAASNSAFEASHASCI